MGERRRNGVAKIISRTPALQVGALNLETSVDRLSCLGQPPEYRPFRLRGDSPVGRQRYVAAGTPGRASGFVTLSCRHQPAAASLRAGHPAPAHYQPRPTEVSRLNVRRSGHGAVFVPLNVPIGDTGERPNEKGPDESGPFSIGWAEHNYTKETITSHKKNKVVTYLLPVVLPVFKRVGQSLTRKTPQNGRQI